MEFKVVLEILDKVLCSKLGIYNTNDVLLEFTAEAVKHNPLLDTHYLKKYTNKCLGCVEKQANQQAHMTYGGCMYLD
jgi:hypothetical protein